MPGLAANSISQKPSQEPKEAAVSSETTSSSDRTNPVKRTPENLADAKKFFGFDCAMCHGTSGDGKGDLAASMSLKMNDWYDSGALAKMSDAERFELPAFWFVGEKSAPLHQPAAPNEIGRMRDSFSPSVSCCCTQGTETTRQIFRAPVYRSLAGRCDRSGGSHHKRGR